MPTYLPDYTDRVGPVAIVMYMLLSRACCVGWEPRWPSVAQLGAMIGLSRSTAERALRALRAVGLIETEYCADEAGQHSNYWDLTDPFDIREQLDSPGAPVAGAVKPDGAPTSPVTGGDVTSDGGAPSPETAPPLRSEEDLRVCVEEDTRTPCAAPAQQDLAGAAVKIVALWAAHLPPGAPGWREAHTAEIAWHAAELLQRGWTVDELAASINTPERDRQEWPRVWAARHGPEALQTARNLARAAEVAQTRAQTLETGRAEIARRMAATARYDALTAERRDELERQVLADRPELAARKGIVKLLALDLFIAEEGAPPTRAAQ